MIASLNSTIGKPIDRVDGRLKVTGGARYAAEATPENLLHAVIVQSTIASGKIRSIDVTAAQSAPGVVAVITPQNMPTLKESKDAMFGEKRLPLSDMQIYYAGQHLAVVVADTLERAKDAASRLKFDCDATPPMIALDDPHAGSEKPPKSFNGQLQYTRGDVQSALSAPGVTVIKQTYTMPVETHNPMEMSATVAAWHGDDQVTVWDATQYVDGVRGAVAAAFGLEPDSVRVLCPYTGGGFGCKGAQWPHILLATAAAKVTGKPVKLMLTRSQMFTSCGHRPQLSQTLTLAAGKDAKLTAISHDTVMHGSLVGDFVEPCGTASSFMMYDSPNLEFSHTVRRINVATPTFMRAPGENPGMYALESAMDELATALSIDPIQLRLINYADKQPSTGMPWSAKNLKQCYQQGADLFGWSKRNSAVGSMRDGKGRLIGWGMATATYPAHRFPGTARIRLYADGNGIRALGAAASQDLGTGTWTIGTQMTAELAGVPIDRARFELGDSLLPVSGVSGGSATAGGLAQALTEAAAAVKGTLLKLSAQGGDSALAGLTPDQVTLRGDVIAATDDPSRSQPIAPLIARSGRDFVEGVSIAPSHIGQEGTVPPPSSRPAKAGGGGEDFNANEHKCEMQSFGAHFVEVAINNPCPRVSVTRVVSVMDIGRVLNSKTCNSQVMGAVVMGIGQTLLEETIYDSRTGRPVTDNLADYAVCVNADIGSIEARFINEPDPHVNAMGCRGVGEIGITGIAAAITSAIYHATGKRVRDLPVTPDKLL
jgi:xanthine dehydrogenase YagR molybdenum-binding subunit